MAEAIVWATATPSAARPTRNAAKAAAPLDLDADHVTYTPLGDLETATEKARRHAPTIPVCEA